MLLKIAKREPGKKGVNNTLRREGHIPAVLYSKGQQGQHLFIDGKDFDSAKRSLKKGFLPSTIFELEDESGKKTKAIVKDITYHVTTYQIQHIDLMELHDDTVVKVKVPILPTGVANCVGIKEGGVLRSIIRHLKVECLPKHIPSHLTIDVSDISLNQSKRLGAIELPEGLKPLINLKEIAVVVAKR